MEELNAPRDEIGPLRFLNRSVLEKRVQSMAKADLVALARVAEAAGRYTDMFEFACAYCYADPVVTEEQRNILAVSFQRLVQKVLRSLAKLDLYIAALSGIASDSFVAETVEHRCPSVLSRSQWGSLSRSTWSIPTVSDAESLAPLFEYWFCSFSQAAGDLVPSEDRASTTARTVSQVIELAEVLRRNALEDIAQLCSTVIMLVTDFLLPAAAPAGKSHVLFFKKLSVDVYRILWERGLLERFRELATSSFRHEVLVAIAGPAATQPSGAALFSHHHLFQYPKISDAGDVAELYLQLFSESQIVLPPLSTVRAAILLNVCDFFMSNEFVRASEANLQSNARTALDWIVRYFCEVELESSASGTSELFKGSRRGERDFLFVLALLKRSRRALEHHIAATSE